MYTVRVDGPVKVLDILGDLGGFAFEDPDTPCANSFADADGNRYITCINADFSDEHPEYVIVTPRGNWKGKSKGGTDPFEGLREDLYASPVTVWNIGLPG